RGRRRSVDHDDAATVGDLGRVVAGDVVPGMGAADHVMVATLGIVGDKDAGDTIPDGRVVERVGADVVVLDRGVVPGQVDAVLEIARDEVAAVGVPDYVRPAVDLQTDALLAEGRVALRVGADVVAEHLVVERLGIKAHPGLTIVGDEVASGDRGPADGPVVAAFGPTDHVDAIVELGAVRRGRPGRGHPQEVALDVHEVRPTDPDGGRIAAGVARVDRQALDQAFGGVLAELQAPCPAGDI